MGRSSGKKKLKTTKNTRSLLFEDNLVLENRGQSDLFIKAILNIQRKASVRGHTNTKPDKGVSLSGKELVDENCSGVNFSDQNIEDALISNCNFGNIKNPDLSSNFDYSEFRDSFIEKSSNFDMSSMTNCYFSTSQFSESSFYKTQFQGSDMSQAKFLDCTFYYSDLSLTVLDNSDFSGSKFNRTLFSKKTPFTQSILDKTIFSEIQIEGPDFNRASLKEIVAEECVFNQALFEEAVFEKASFKNVKADDSSFKGALIDESIFLESSFKNSDFGQAKIQYSRFDNVDLSGADLSLVDLDGVIFAACKIVNTKFPEDLGGSAFFDCTSN